VPLTGPLKGAPSMEPLDPARLATRTAVRNRKSGTSILHLKQECLDLDNLGTLGVPQDAELHSSPSPEGSAGEEEEGS